MFKLLHTLFDQCCCLHMPCFGMLSLSVFIFMCFCLKTYLFTIGGTHLCCKCQLCQGFVAVPATAPALGLGSAKFRDHILEMQFEVKRSIILANA